MKRVAFTFARILCYGIALSLGVVALGLATFGFLVGSFGGLLFGLALATPALVPAWGAWHFFDAARTARL